ncbi:hypothetical protein C8R43DRAFT_1013576 [Mycena crocata]|nr:hypothetical protein C8R43DRAFT_1013576 [Mycena crocata]
MPPRRGKAKAAPATAVEPIVKKRPAEDASQSAPAAKKARQSASKASTSEEVAPAAEVIEISSDEEDLDDGKVASASPREAVVAAALDVLDDLEEEFNEDSDQDGSEDGMKALPQKVRDRLEYIASHTDGLTSTYPKMITRELPGYMGRGGTNADVAANIANHCGFQAQMGEDLEYEKRLVKGVHRMCWGGCGE